MTNETRLYNYVASYRTPSGRKTYVIGIKRGRIEGCYTSLDDSEQEHQLLIDAMRNIRVDICANPNRKVAYGVSGVVINHIEAGEQK